jgi:hypothetical protein
VSNTYALTTAVAIAVSEQEERKINSKSRRDSECQAKKKRFAVGDELKTVRAELDSLLKSTLGTSHEDESALRT